MIGAYLHLVSQPSIACARHCPKWDACETTHTEKAEIQPRMKPNPTRAAVHDLRLEFGVDEADEISGEEQLQLVWCATHAAWEWHCLPLDKPRPRPKPPHRVGRKGRKGSAARDVSERAATTGGGSCRREALT